MLYYSDENGKLIPIALDNQGNTDGLVALKTKTLWTNPSPSSSFTAQTVNVSNMSEYDYYIVYANDYTGGGYKIYAFAKVEERGSTTLENWNIPYNSSYFRRVEYTQNTVSFGHCYTNRDATANNTIIIPTRIVGIKLVNSYDKLNKFSIDETIVGEWIDGKPIYRKVFNNLNILCATVGWKEVGSLNFETIVNSYFICNTTNETTRYRTSPLAYCNLSFYNNKCYIAGTGAWDGNSLVLKTVVVEYTKTTD